MESIGVQVAILLAILLLIERLYAARRPGGRTGGLDLALTWLAVTALSMWCVGTVWFAFVYALLFAFGTLAAWVGAAAGVAILLAIPIGWARFLRHRAAVRG